MLLSRRAFFKRIVVGVAASAAVATGRHPAPPMPQRQRRLSLISLVPVPCRSGRTDEGTVHGAGWAINLVVAEWIIRWRPRGHAALVTRSAPSGR